MQARSSYKTFLMYKPSASSAYTKLVDIKNFPDLGGAPEQLETTTTSDHAQTFINGIQSIDALTFETNYNLTAYKALKDLEGATYSFAVWFGGTGEGETLTPTGADGKWNFDGELSVYVNGAGVNEVVNMTVTIAPSTPIEFNDPSGATGATGETGEG